MATLPQVLSDRERYTNVLLGRASRPGFSDIPPAFDAVHMDAVVAMDDDILRRCFEFIMVDNSHFAHNMLPGVGQAIGDLHTVGDNVYLAFQTGLAEANNFVLHCLRAVWHEYEKYDWRELVPQVGELIDRVDGVSTRRFGITELGLPPDPPNWTRYLGLPRKQFTSALDSLAQRLFRQKEKGTNQLAKLALGLYSDLHRFAQLDGTIGEILHAGELKEATPVKNQGQLELRYSRACIATGLHSVPPGDDLIEAVPTADDVFMIAATAGVIPIPVIGGSNLRGEHYIFMPPKYPYYMEVNRGVHGSQELRQLWQELGYANHENVGAASEQAEQWATATKPVKQKIAREVIPGFVDDQVLGFKLSLDRHPLRVAFLCPIVSKTCAERNKAALMSAECSVNYPRVDSMAVVRGDNLAVPRSVFDE